MCFPILEGSMDGLAALIIIIFFIGFGIPVILGITGWITWTKGNKKTAKIFFIISVIYLLISLGICGSLMI